MLISSIFTDACFFPEDIILFMFESNKGLRSPDRHQRRKPSKSPINIRGKIKELQGQLEKNNKHREGPKMPLTFHSAGIPKLNSHPVRTKHSKQPDHNHHHFMTNGVEMHNSPPKHKNHHHNQDRLHYDRRYPHTRDKQAREINHRRNEIPLWHSQSPKNKSRKRFTEKPEQNLERLKEQNEKFREIYLKSVKKIQDLEDRLTQMRVQQQNEKNNLETTYQILQSRVQTKKIPLAHIYTYQQKNNNLIVVQEKIIAETDNQNSSSHFDLDKMKKRSQSFSGLSLQSK